MPGKYGMNFYQLIKLNFSFFLIIDFKGYPSIYHGHINKSSKT